MSRKLFLFIAFAAIFAMSLMPAIAANDKDQLLQYYAKGAGTGLEYTYKITVDGELMSTSIVKIKGVKSYMESQMEGMKSFMINDGQYLYTWTSMSNMGQKIDPKQYENKGEASASDIEDPNVQVKILGYETVNGYYCMKAEIKIEGTVQYHWVSEKFGVTVRVVMEEMQMDVTDIKIKDHPDSTFVPPSNISFGSNLFSQLGALAQQGAQQAAQAVQEAQAAFEANKPVNEAQFLSIIAKRGSIPAVYTEKYDNMLNTKVKITVKGNKEYRVVDAAVKLYMMYDGVDIYTWNSMIKTVSKVKANDALLKLLSPYDPSIMYAKDFEAYEYIGSEEVNSEQCRHARVFYNGKSYELWVSERLGILMRIVVGDVGMTVSTLAEQDVPDTTFQFPTGYKLK